MSEPWRPPPSVQHALDLAEMQRVQPAIDLTAPTSAPTHPRRHR